MTTKSFSKAIKSLIVFLISLCVFCACAFAVACGGGSSDSESTEKTYTYTETDTETISNANFVYGTHDKTADDFPITSLTGWTRSVDNSAASSNVDSGVVSVGSNSWNKVFDKLYADSDFIKIYENKYKTDLDGKTDDEKKDFIKDKFANPEKHDGAADSFIYMLNNFSTKTGKGTAQRLRSSSSVSVKKGETYKISVWVKTNILNGDGANIRLTNAVNGNSQAEFRIDGIKNTDWTEYTVYFVAHEDYDCTFTLTLGLGYGNGSGMMQDYVEGTAFFDDVKVEKFDGDISTVTFDDNKTLEFGSNEPISVSPAGDNVFKYDMNFDIGTYFTDITSATQTVDLDKENKTVEIKNGTDNFEITTADEDDYQKYLLVSFKLQNKLNKLGSTDITVNVVDIFGAITETRKAVATFSDVSDDDKFTTCNILVRNNFKNQPREFYLELVIGPETLSEYVYENATGNVVIKDVKYSAGYVSSEKYTDKADDPEYKLYSFFNSDTDATVALYAGYNADYEEHNHSTTYSLTPAKGNVGEITDHPTAVNGYSGIVSNHVLVKGESGDTQRETVINDRTSFSGADGYAGLINTKYMTTYASGDSNLESILNCFYDDENNIQPIVIYNKNADHYGFIGKQQTVSASAYAKVTVKLFVTENAKAYIYLIDTSKSEKDVLQFADFTVNTTEGLNNATINGKTYAAADHKFMLIIDKDAARGDDNFVEVNFYIATGANSKSFRVEVWNGGRDGSDTTASNGYVVINSIEVSTSSAFTEPTSLANVFTDSGNPLYNHFDTDGTGFIAYTRELTDTEKAFNKEYPDQAVSYKPTYVWAQNDTTIYAVLNTINPVEHNPYDDLPADEEGSGCAAETDPSTFWLSFSTILLAVVLVAAIVALFIKRFALRRKANKSDAVSRYKVKSRTETQKEIKKTKERFAKQSETEEQISEETEDEPVSEDLPTDIASESEEGAENTGDETEQTGYVYGDVQDFGDMTFEVPEENKTEDGENSEDKKDE